MIALLVVGVHLLSEIKMFFFFLHNLGFQSKTVRFKMTADISDDFLVVHHCESKGIVF